MRGTILYIFSKLSGLFNHEQGLHSFSHECDNIFNFQSYKTLELLNNFDRKVHKVSEMI